MGEEARIPGKKVSGEIQGGWGNEVLPVEYLNIVEPFKYGVHYECTPWNPAPVGKEYKGQGHTPQAGGDGGDPYAGKGRM